MAFQAVQPYLGMYGEGSNYFHDDYPRLLKACAQLQEKNALVDMNQWKQNEHYSPFWKTHLANIATNKLDDNSEEYITSDTLIRSKVIMSRLSHTPPGKLFTYNTKDRTVPASNPSRAWRAVIEILGSSYPAPPAPTTQKQASMHSYISKTSSTNPDESPPQDDTTNPNKNAQDATTDQMMIEIDEPQEKLPAKGATASKSSLASAAQDKQPTQMEIEIETPTKPQKKKATDTNPKGTATITPSKGAGSKPGAIPELYSRENKLRVGIKLKPSEKLKNKSPNQNFLHVFKEMFSVIKENVPTAILLPWKIDATDKPITCPDDIPTTLPPLKPYFDKVPRLDGKRDAFLRIIYGFNEEEKSDLLSFGDSCSKWWFEANGHLAWEELVQDSDNPVMLGHLNYSGPFVDHHRVMNYIKQIHHKQHSEFLKAACKPKKLQALVGKDNSKQWRLPDNQPIQIHCDAAQAHMLKSLLLQIFGPRIPREQKPGQYPFTFVPAPAFFKGGPKSLQERAAVLQKHKAVIGSLQVHTTQCIKHLDASPQEWADRKTGEKSQITLRKVLSSIPASITGSKSTSPQMLYFTIDFGQSNMDVQNGITIFTSYKNHEPLASSLIQVLPDYVLRFYGETYAKAWFHPNFIPSPEYRATFEVDDNDNWTGIFTTADDNNLNEALTEDLGIEFDFDLSALSIPDSGHAITMTDDGTIHSFFSATGTQRPDPSQLAGSAPPAASQASAAPGGAGGAV
jgi:hypothetical protein